MSSLSAQDIPQQQISGDERDFVTTAEPIRQPLPAVFGPAEPFRRGELLRRDSSIEVTKCTQLTCVIGPQWDYLGRIHLGLLPDNSQKLL